LFGVNPALVVGAEDWCHILLEILFGCEFGEGNDGVGVPIQEIKSLGDGVLFGFITATEPAGEASVWFLSADNVKAEEC